APPIRQLHSLFETYLSKLEKSCKRGNTCLRVTTSVCMTDNSFNDEFSSMSFELCDSLNSLFIDLIHQQDSDEDIDKDYLREEELRLCLEEEERLHCEHEKLIVEEKMFRLEEAKKLRLEEEKMLQLAEEKNIKQKEFMNSTHDLWVDYMRHVRSENANWAMVSSYFVQLLMQNGMPLFYANGGRHEQIMVLQRLIGSTVAVESLRLLKELQDDELEKSKGMMKLISETQLKLGHGLSLDVDDPVDVSMSFEKPPFCSLDNSKRNVSKLFMFMFDDSAEKYSIFEVNYDGIFIELPLWYEYGKLLSLKLANSNRMSNSKMLDMLVYKLECEILGLFYCIPRNSLEIGLTIIEGDSDMKKISDMAELYGLITLYIAHLPRNLATYYYKNLTFDASDEDMKYKLKSHEKLKLDASSMSFDEIVS
ncbi:hypothetical protein Tco_0885848, partial [Tanacetum coccineum]